MAKDLQDRQRKYRRSNKPDDTKIKDVLGLDDTLMNYLCSYLVSTNKKIKRFGLSNLKKFVVSLSPDNFNKNPLLQQKYQFLLQGIDNRLSGMSGDIVLSDIKRHSTTPNLFEQNFIKELNDTEIKYIEDTIMGYLHTMVFDNHIETLKDICNKYSEADISQRDKIVDHLRTELNSINSDFRKYDITHHNAATMFRLSSMDEFEEEIDKFINDPAQRLITGMHAFNGILGGGFQKTRLYCLFGMAGEGKTVTMVNLLYQVWKHNKGVKLKDVSKKPCICLFTMENLVIEYVCSLFHIITCGDNIRDYSSGKEALEEFKRRKFEYSDENDIELIISYEPGFTKDVNHMYDMVEELREEGFETIIFFVDYLMRILPSRITGDPYIDYGTVANDFKTFAIMEDIPVVTASQLNREAAKIIDEGRSSNQSDIIRKLGRATIGDSINIDRNIDASIILVPEKDQYEQRYMAFKMTKHRFEIYTDVVSFFQPIHMGSYISFVEDIHEPKPAYRLSLLKPEEEELKEIFGNDIQKVSIRPIDSIKQLAEKASTKLVETFVEPKEEPQYGLSPEKLVEKTALTQIVTVSPIENRKEKP